MKKYQITMALIGAVLLLGLSSMARAAEKKVKVFILAGQSNMEGHGHVRPIVEGQLFLPPAENRPRFVNPKP